MSLRLEQTLRQTTRLNTEQRLELKQLLQIRLALVAEPPPEAKTGLEGIGEAHKLLQEKKLRGVLIGSLAADIWKTGDASSLARHKDVDVAVLPEVGETAGLGTFEGGVDWWEPHTEKLDVRSDAGSVKGSFTWWENGNGVVIGVGLQLARGEATRLNPGLYIPTPDWLINMRIEEILARVDERKVSDEALYSLRTKLEKELNPKKFSGSGVVLLTQFVPYRFQFGLDKLPPEATHPLNVEAKTLREIVAINSRHLHKKQDSQD